MCSLIARHPQGVRALHAVVAVPFQLCVGACVCPCHGDTPSCRGVTCVPGALMPRRLQDVQDKSGLSPLHFAVGFNQAECVKALLGHDVLLTSRSK